VASCFVWAVTWKFALPPILFSVNLDGGVYFLNKPVAADEARRACEQAVHDADHQTVGEVDQPWHKMVNRELLREEHQRVQENVERREGRSKETPPPPVVVLKRK